MSNPIAASPGQWAMVATIAGFALDKRRKKHWKAWAAAGGIVLAWGFYEVTHLQFFQPPTAP